MKKLLFIVVSILVIALFYQRIPETVYAASTADGYEYTIDGDSVIIIDYKGENKAINIPATIEGYSVTSVGDRAFYDCCSLTSINIPSSVTSIGDEAFYNCDSLTSINIPSSVTSIGDKVFYSCDSLTSVSIPNSVTSIGAGAFYGCSELASVNIPSSVTSIGDGAFYGCLKLASVSIPSSVTSIGAYTFIFCESLTSVSIPSSVISIGNFAFDGCRNLISISIPSSVTSIGEYAFFDCSSLTSISIPSSVTRIGSAAFFNCRKLISVSIPNSVNNIENYTFKGCSSLTSISIPSSVTNIGDKAFSDCSNLISAVFYGNAPIMGEGVFDVCSIKFKVYYISGNIGYTSEWYGYITLPAYIVTIEAVTGGSIHVNSFTASEGDTINLNILPEAGMRLKVGSLKYNDDAQNVVINGTSFVMPASDITVTAEFEKIPVTFYNVTVGTLAGGSITASQITSSAGVTINITITPEAGKRLKQGSLKYNDGLKDVLITGTSFLMPEADVTVFAEFEKTPGYIISHIVNFKDWNGTVLKTETVNDGEAATAPSNPSRTSYTFTGWDVSFSNVTSDLNVTAQYSIVGSMSGGSGSTEANKARLPKIKGSVTVGWTSIIMCLKELKSGSIVIEMNGNTKVEQEVFEVIKGKDIEIIFILENGFEWTIHGVDISESTDLQDIDFDLKINTENIPEETLDTLPDDNGIQFSFTHDGPFGFTAALKIYLDNQNSRKMAYLYYFNPETKLIEFQSSVVIGQDGYAQFQFTQASDYVILLQSDNIIKKSMGLISVSPDKKTIYYGGTKGNNVTLNAVIPEVIKAAAENGLCKMSISYSSSNTKVAIVTASGKVATKKAGNTIITTTITVNGESLNFKTVITVKKAYIKLTKSTESMKLGDSFNFKALGYGVDTENIIYVTTKKSVITIDRNTGKAKAISLGTDYIIAKVGDIHIKTKVTVK